MKRTHLCLSWMRETFLLVILTIVSLGALAEDRAERLRDNLFNTPKQFTARVASGLRGGQIEVRIDSLQGEILARLEVPSTGGWEKWQTISVDIDNSNFKNKNSNSSTFNSQLSTLNFQLSMP